jgi:hypothetical protein
MTWEVDYLDDGLDDATSVEHAEETFSESVRMKA